MSEGRAEHQVEGDVLRERVAIAIYTADDGIHWEAEDPGGWVRERYLILADAALRETLTGTREEISRMLDGFPQRGRHTRARWAMAWLDVMIERVTRPGASS
ncbi:hypothetical protein [Nocardioides sp. YIM 152315]|uniref:hypothetical protein n=1 Tax=Nocardioides sp. YIM 152315 TaxID=3031760 RepID=UPI0023DBFE8A|nr:hypothetical protein [Nocardioides sp. YIM 152315]MDF1603381.1 hypothetical protein [Nocardioides sp. YIM 152315]